MHEFKKYEREARKRLVEYFKSEHMDFKRFVRNFAADVYNRGDGLVFMDFNEKTQRSFLRAKYIAWITSLSHEVCEALNKTKAPAPDSSEAGVNR